MPDDAQESALINVEVAYASPAEQRVIACHVKRGETMLSAVIQSGILSEFPQIDLEKSALGIYGKLENSRSLRLLREGDRVEIYRPLLIDPKEARKKRAEKLKSARREDDE